MNFYCGAIKYELSEDSRFRLEPVLPFGLNNLFFQKKKNQSRYNTYYETFFITMVEIFNLEMLLQFAHIWNNEIRNLLHPTYEYMLWYIYRNILRFRFAKHDDPMMSMCDWIQ